MSSRLFDLTGKVAIVTGAGRGIGKSIALGLARHGADVVLCSRTPAELEQVAQEVQKLGQKALPIVVDMAQVSQFDSLVTETQKAFKHIDILVNNAGGAYPTQVLEMSVNDWEETVKENLSSVFICSRIVGEVMVKQKAGNIISMSSVMGLDASDRNAAYGASKAGIISLTKTLAVQWAPYNIRVNAIAPGFINTPGTSKIYEDPRVLQARLSKIPLGRLGKAEDIVGVAIFLASDASAYITGETIVVNGGLTSTVTD